MHLASDSSVATLPTRFSDAQGRFIDGESRTTNPHYRRHEEKRPMEYHPHS